MTPTLALGEERPSADDVEYAHRFVDLLTATLEARYTAGSTLRDFHPKMHGCVEARLVIGDDVPETLRHGLFAVPGEFRAWVRLSNGSPMVRDDRRRDIRGFAMKVVGVPGPKLLDAETDGTSQDFLLASHPFFGIRTVKEFYGIQTAMDRGVANLLAFVLNPFDSHLRTMWMLMRSMTPCTDMLGARYWSVTPYRLGPHAVKYGVFPVGEDFERSRRGSPDYLRERLVAHLADRPARFDLCVQVQTDPRRQPVEDPTVVWDERECPFQSVARVEISVQDAGGDAARRFGENLAFNPWRSIEAHRPLGGANLARKIIYQAMSAYRRRRNDVPLTDPGPDDRP